MDILTDIVIGIVITIVAGVLATFLSRKLGETKWYKNKQYRRQLVRYIKKVSQQIKDKDNTFFSYFSLDKNFDYEKDYVLQNGIRLDYSKDRDQINMPLTDTLENYILKSILDNGQTYFCVVGEFGTGKSSLLFYLFKNYLTNHYTKTKKVPIFLSMKSFENADGRAADFFEQTANFLSAEYNLDKITLDHLRTSFVSGEIILFIDGLDEYMHQHNRLPYELVNIGGLLGNESKAVIATRPSIFQGSNQFRDIVKLSSDIHLISNLAKMTFLQIDFLRREQIVSILEGKGISPGEIQFLLENENIFELCRHHLLLKMVIKTLPDLKTTAKMTDIYESYIKSCFKGDDLLQTPQLFDIFEKIALWIYEHNCEYISTENIAAIANGLLEKLNIQAKDLLFLSQEEGDFFRFIHRSFMEYFVARGLVNAIRNRNLTTIHNIKSVVYHEEVSRFARELLCEKDRKELLGLCKSQEPWMRFIGAHFLSRINAVDAKKEISIILQDESDFIVKRELYISLAFLGEVAEFHNYITLLDNLDMRQQNDRLIFDYFGSQSNTIKGCVERLSKDFAYPTREMIIDYLGRYGGREQIPVLRYYYSDLNCIRETTINAISQIKLRNPRPHLIKLIILDMDGVIIDSITQQISAWADAANRFEISFSGDDEQFIRFTEGKKSSDIASELLIKHGQNPALAEALVQMKNTMMETKMDIKPIGGIIELIQIAKRRNIKLAVVTSSNRLWAEYVLRTLQIKSEIDVIVTADDVENGKPSPEPYEQALRELSIQSSYAAAIENSPYGIDSAQAANIFCFGITSTLTADSLMAADETIVDYAALYPLL